MLKLITLLVFTGTLFEITLAADVSITVNESAESQPREESPQISSQNGYSETSNTVIDPSDCKENEEYSKCGRDGCLKYYCSDLDLPPLCRDGPCVAKCECKEGFLRASFDNDTCVPIDQCERKCKDNEQFSYCPSGTCQPQTCKEAGYPVPCPSLGPNGECPGEPGCICNYGFLRDDSGKCIPKEQCPSCGGDENAISGCGNHCGNSCGTYNSSKPLQCPLFCNINGCDCRDKFVYDDNLDKCVSPDKCSQVCKANEEFATCIQGVCRVQNCVDKGKNIPCPGIKEGSCITGCVCKENFLRAENGTCVPQEQCDQTCPYGEILSNCPPVKCDSEYCPLSRNDPLTCPSSKKCESPRCVCGFNRHRDRETGKCIATADCPPFPCNGPNEKYQSCPPICPGESCSDYLRNATCPKYRIGIVVHCKPDCRCNKGYYRDTKGICVSQNKCKVPTNPPAEGTCNNVDAQVTALEYGNTAFTGKFLYQVVKSNPEVSVIMSAFSALTPLALLALYSKGQTNKELMSAINLKTPDDIRCAFPKLLDSIKASNGTELDSGAKLYVYKQGQLSKSLQDDSEKVLRAKAESLDFNNPDNASNVINQWVSDVTKGKITKLTSADMFDSMTRLVVANAIYFKGLWEYEFNPNNTIPRDFYVNSNKTIQVPTMQQKGKFQYAEISDPDIQAVVLPYKGKDITFMAILPKNINGLLSVVEKMQDPEMLNNIYSNLTQQTVTIYLPKIAKVSTRINLIDVLKSIGIKAVFDPTKAELSGMTDPDEPLYVSDAVQEATITVDEKGSEAAAANAAVVSTRAMPLPPQPFGVTALSATIGQPREYVFNADHPYALYINHHQTTLFCGAFYG